MMRVKTFVQSTPSTSWVIDHAFIDTPRCDVLVTVNSEVQKILPKSLELTSSTQVTITFSVATSGTARLIGTVADQTAGISGAGTIDPGAGTIHVSG